MIFFKIKKIKKVEKKTTIISDHKKTSVQCRLDIVAEKNINITWMNVEGGGAGGKNERITYEKIMSFRLKICRYKIYYNG